MSNETVIFHLKNSNLVRMQYKIILFKLFITLSNILFVKPQRCTENPIIYWFGDIKTCYLEVSCPTNTSRYTHYGAVPDAPHITTYCCQGYTWHTYNGTRFCIPVCSYRCVNARCTEPNTCTCHNGYVKSRIHPSVCDPSCQPSCIRGTCITPNTCKCPDDSNMFVNNRNECVCKKGFEMNKSGVCIPLCEPACVNGECTAPNQCVCSPGYQPTQVQNTCESICLKNCIHGNCTDGNCICEDEWFGSDCNSTAEIYTHDSHRRFPIEIVLSLTTLVLFGLIYFLYKKQVFHCKQKSHDVDLDNFEENSLYGWVPK